MTFLKKPLSSLIISLENVFENFGMSQMMNEQIWNIYVSAGIFEWSIVVFSAKLANLAQMTSNIVKFCYKNENARF